MHCGNPFDLRGAMHGFNSSVHPQALELRNDERHGNHKCDPVGKGRCPCDTGNTDSAIQNQHEHHVQTALAKKRQAKRLHLLADRLKDGDDHKIDRGRRAGKADDLQKCCPYCTVSVSAMKHREMGAASVQRRTAPAQATRKLYANAVLIADFIRL